MCHLHLNDPLNCSPTLEGGSGGTFENARLDYGQPDLETRFGRILCRCRAGHLVVRANASTPTPPPAASNSLNTEIVVHWEGRSTDNGELTVESGDFSGGRWR